MRVKTVRSSAEEARISALKDQCKSLVRDSGRRPGSLKLMTGICLFLLDYLSEMPGAEVKLRQAVDGLQQFSSYKVRRDREPRPVAKINPREEVIGSGKR